jgi:hypothetical protein
VVRNAEDGMRRPIIVFEDDRVSSLYPLMLTRPVFDLRCGILQLADKIRIGLKAISERGGDTFWKLLPNGDADIRFHLRDYLATGREGSVESYGRLSREFDVLTFLNGRLLFEGRLVDAIDPDWKGKYVCDETVVFANIPRERIGSLDGRLGMPIDKGFFSDLPSRSIDARMISHPWDAVRQNGEEIHNDFLLLGGGHIDSEPAPGVYLINEAQIGISPDVSISPGVVMDATAGPISIGSGTVLMSNVSVKGPVHIGSGSVVKMGAKIYGQTTIGPVCRVGGEVAETIIQGYANKQHEGFLGHSYLGEWVNLGAGTNTSDMKNNYSTVRVSIAGEPVDSGQMFVGLYAGDHSKTGIGMIFNTGSVVGICCNLYGADYPPKYIPSFTWGGASGFEEHDLERALVTTSRVMERRGKSLGPLDQSVLKHVFDLTSEERQAFLGS